MERQTHWQVDYPDTVTKYILTRAEYVYDNTINPAQNIWNGLRWKIYMDVNMPMSEGDSKGANFNLGVDARHYWKIYTETLSGPPGLQQTLAGAQQKMIYYLGGVDGWVNPKFNNRIQPSRQPTKPTHFQSLGHVNMRGFNQNVANGNNAVGDSTANCVSLFLHNLVEQANQ
jgi:hypothetical protein